MDPRDKGTPEIEWDTISLTVLKDSKHPVSAIHVKLLSIDIFPLS